MANNQPQRTRGGAATTPPPKRYRRPTSQAARAKRDAELKPYGDYFHQQAQDGRWGSK